jgi:curli biogenesis system outer membrane secretion channel CsgG
MKVRRNSLLLVCLVASVVMLGTGGAIGADYVAYAVNEEGEKSPLPENVDPIAEKNAKHLVRVEWGEFDGPRMRIAVNEVQNTSSVATYRVTGADGTTMSASWSAEYNQVPVDGIEAMISAVLNETGRFRLMERVKLDTVLDEQDLGASGRVAKPSAAKIGKVLGAKYMFEAVVTSYEPNFKGKSGGVGGWSRKLKALGGVKGGKSKSMVQMAFRLIDSESSELVFTKNVSVVISETSFGLGGLGWGGSGALGGFMSGYSKTPIGQAVIAAVNVGAFELIKQVGNQPAAGSVAKVSPENVMITLGQGRVEAGETVKVVSKGEEIVDPETGEVLGTEDEDIGTLKVTAVKEKYSYAEPVGFDRSVLKTGDRVVSLKEPPPLSFASSWVPPGKD